MHIKQRALKQDKAMSQSIVPQHAECMILNPADWTDLFKGGVARTSIESGHLVWDNNRSAYFPAIDEIFQTTFNATNAMSKHATVVCSGVMTVFITNDQIKDADLTKTLDILSYANDEDTTYDGVFADVRVHLPIPSAF